MMSFTAQMALVAARDPKTIGTAAPSNWAHAVQMVGTAVSTDTNVTPLLPNAYNGSPEGYLDTSKH